MGTINDQQCEELCGKEVSNVPCFDVKAIIRAIGELTVTFAESISAGNEFEKRCFQTVSCFAAAATIGAISSQIHGG